MAGLQLRPSQEQGDVRLVVSGGGDQRLDRGLAEPGALVVQQELDRPGVERLDQRLGHDLADVAAPGDHLAVLGSGLPDADDEVAVAEGVAILQQRASDLRLVAQQQAHERIGNIAEVRQALGRPQAIRRRRLAEHLHQKVAGHRPLEPVDPGQRQANHVGQALDQRQSRPADRERGGFGSDLGLGHRPIRAQAG